MAKVTIARIFDLSKALGTPSGKELQDVLQFLSDFSELTLRLLTNGQNFEDNLNTQVKTLQVRHNEETIVGITSRSIVSRIYLDRVLDSKYYMVNGFGWTIDPRGNVVVKVSFADAPPPTVKINVNIVIHFA